MAGDAEINVVVELQAKVEDAISAINNMASAVGSAMQSLRDNISDTMSGVQSDMADKAQAAGTEAGSQLSSGFKDGTDKLEGHTQDGMQKVHTAAVEGASKAGEESSRGFVENFASGLNTLFAYEGLKFLDSMKEKIEELGQKATKLKTLSLETGDSEEQLQRLQYAFASVGVSSDRAQRMFAQFQAKLEQAASANNGKSEFERLGLDPKAMQGNDVMTNLNMVADKIRNLKESSQQTQAASSLFSRLLGPQLLPLLDQGSAGLKKLEASADGAGAVIGKMNLAKFHEFHVEMMQLSQTADTFMADFVAPFMDAINRVITGVQNLYAAFERLSTQSKLGIVFGGLTAIFFSAEKALEFFKSRLTPGIFTTLGEGLLPFLGTIRLLVALVGTFSAAWQANFANARAPLTEIGQALLQLAQNAEKFFSQAKAIFDSTLGPALSELSKALAPVLQEFADASSSILSSNDAWSAALGVVQALASALAVVISWLAKCVNWYQQNRTWINAIAIAIGTTLIPYLTILASYAGLGLLVRGFMSVFTAVQVAIGAINAFRLGLIALMFSNPILAAIQIIFLLIAVAVGVVIANWSKWGATVEQWGANTMRWISMVLGGLAKFLEYLGDVISKAPGMEAVGIALKGIGEAAQWSADRTKDLADNLQKLHDNFGKGGGKHKGGAKKKKPTDDEDDDYHGDAMLTNPPAKGEAGEAARENIDAIKQGLEPLKGALKDNEFEATKLDAAIKQLGDINTPQKLAAAQAYYNAQISNTIREKQLEQELAARAFADAARLSKLASEQKDPKIKREYTSAATEMKGEGQGAQSKVYENESKIQEIRKQALTTQMDYLKGQEELAGSYSKALSILEKELAVAVRMSDAAKERLEVEKAILALKNQQIEDSNKLANAKIDQQIASLKSSKGAQESQIDKSDPDYENEKKTADDQLLLQEATLKLTQAQNDQNTAQEKLNNVLEQTPNDFHAISEARAELTDAETAAITATNDLEDAQRTLKQDTMATYQQTLQVRSGFDKLAQQVAGPLYGAIQNIVTGMNPLVAIFQALVSQSGSFRDVQRALTEISQALAQVFDMLRPAVDLLLGVVMGCVDVFLAMYNVLVDLIRMLGINVQRINMLNANLNDLNQTAQPLLQITHDLPTMNEYNDGKWGPLIAKQEEQTNVLNNGFNQQAVKLGEIAGTLLGIRMVLSVVMGQGLFGKGGGIFGMFKNSFGGAKKAASGGGASTAETQNTQAVTSETQAVTQNTAALQQARASTTQNSTTTQQNTTTTQQSNTAHQQNTSAVTQGTAANRQNTSAHQHNSTSLRQNTTTTQQNSTAHTQGTTATTQNTAATQQNNAITQTNTTAHTTGTTALTAQTAATTGQTVGTAGNTAVTGGNSLAVTGNTVATSANTAALGIVGAAIAVLTVAMTVFGGLFGKKPGKDEPDITDTQNYGQGTANLVGTAGANGQSFTESASDLQTFGGLNGIQAVQNTLAQYGSEQNAPAWLQPMFNQLEQVFGENSGSNGGLSYGKNIGEQTVTGATTGGGVEESYTTLATLLNQFAQAVQNSVGSLQNLNDQAGDMNLAAMFGNGVTTVNGGYSVTPGGTGGDGAPSTPQVNVNIENVHGTDPDTITAALQPALTAFQQQLSRQQKIATRNMSSLVGRVPG